ncbi:MAG: DUF4350 domain-containing protein [Amphritea sp.]
MSSANRIVLWLMGLLLVAALVWFGAWFIKNYERDTRDVLVEVSPEAMRNRFLAAERFLQAIGHEVGSVSGLELISDLPPTGDALVLRGLHRGISDEQLKKLTDWIEAGGNLILVPVAFWSEDNPGDPLLGDMGVRLVSDTDRLEEAQSVVADELRADEEEDTRYEQVSVPVSSESSPVTANFLKGRYLVDSQEWANRSFGNDWGYHMLRYELGSGEVIVLSDLQLFENDHIGKQDHAFLLSLLTSGSRKVWLQYSIDMPSLPQLLWQRIPFVVVMVVVSLMLMGWRLFLFSGPRLNLRYNERRNLLEHIDASATYAWRIDKGSKLFAENRSAVEKAWRHRHPLLNAMDTEQLCEWIGEKTGISASAIARTLYGEIGKEQDFIRATAVLQKLAIGLNKRELG